MSNAVKSIPFPLVALDADADGLHAATNDPWWREAWYFEFCDPKSKLQWQSYQGVFPNQGTGDLTLAVFTDGRLEQQVLKMDYKLPLEPIQERLRFAGLKLELLEPFRLWRLRYDTAEVQADLQFEAIHAPYSWAESRLFMENSDTEQRSQHFDQVGRYTGRVWVRGKEFNIDALGFRDRMWGWGARRQWRNYIVLWSALDADFVSNVSVQGFMDGSHHLCGYLYRDGKRSLLKHARVNIEWHPTRWKTILRLQSELEDQLGRRAVVEGRPQGITDTSHHWPHRVDNMLFTVAEYKSDGRTGYGCMNWSFLNEDEKPMLMEASL